jgi:hypothetical protein
MSETRPFAVDEANSVDFDKCLSREYGIILLDTGNPVYAVPGVRCDDCGAMNEMLYAPTLPALDLAMEASGSASATVNEEEYDEDDPEVGFLICASCGEGKGADISDDSRVVVDVDTWKEYVMYRSERDLPL